jgi:hypothetical protein
MIAEKRKLFFFLHSPERGNASCGCLKETTVVQVIVFSGL